MSVHTCTYTQTRTEVYVSAKIAYALQVILTELGLHVASRSQDWDSVELAASTWLAERTLKAVKLEIIERSSGKVVAVFDVDVDYSSGAARMRHDAELSRLAARKVKNRVSVGSLDADVRMRTEDWRTDVPGWGRTTARDASGLTRRTIGELARGPGIVSEMSYRV